MLHFPPFPILKLILTQPSNLSGKVPSSGMPFLTLQPVAFWQRLSGDLCCLCSSLTFHRSALHCSDSQFIMCMIICRMPAPSEVLVLYRPGLVCLVFCRIPSPGPRWPAEGVQQILAGSVELTFLASHPTMLSPSLPMHPRLQPNWLLATPPCRFVAETKAELVYPSSTPMVQTVGKLHPQAPHSHVSIIHGM